MNVVRGFSLSNARLLADLCAQAYTTATIETDLCHIVSTPAEFAEDGQPYSILAFRGSKSPLDFLTDAKIKFARLPGGQQLHEGFHASVSSIWDQLLKLDQRAPPAPVILTGHSKGGGEALIAAFLLNRAGRHVHSVYTFGAPRVGDRNFKRDYNLALGFNTWSWIHEEDIVPRLPPCILKGYRRAGTICFLPAFGHGFLWNPWIGYMLLSDVWGAWKEYRQGRDAFLADHPIARYQTALANL